MPHLAPIILLSALLPRVLAANGEQTDAIVRIVLAIIAAVVAWLQGRRPPEPPKVMSDRKDDPQTRDSQD